MEQEHFPELKAYKNDFELPREFVQTWVRPFYGNIGSDDEEWTALLQKSKRHITEEVVMHLLGDYNWRARQTGAYFAAIKNFGHLADIIGVQLLKSELTYAGKVYAWVLAYFNTPETVNYLDKYLEYYLLQPELWFDQHDVINALYYLDKVNGTNKVEKHLANWKTFLKNKPTWSEVIEADETEAQVNYIKAVNLNQV